VLFADLNLDGWVDLSVANGHLYPQLDTLEGLTVIQNSGYRQGSLLFRNVGNRRFMEIGERIGAGFRSRDRGNGDRP
jgi:enediyne biosynthesis protein E4